HERQRRFEPSLESRFEIFVEDQISMIPVARLNYATYHSDGRDDVTRWSWDYRLTLNYYFDKILF
ncbi:MAG: hypothetical protein ABIF77_03770, partial [bacterium]